MKIKWTLEHFLSDTSNETKSAIPVVRLAEVDAVIAEAVWAMEWLAVGRAHAIASHLQTGIGNTETQNALAVDEQYQRAKAFLASPLVLAWRARQKEQP